METPLVLWPCAPIHSSSRVSITAVSIPASFHLFYSSASILWSCFALALALQNSLQALLRDSVSCSALRGMRELATLGLRSGDIAVVAFAVHFAPASVLRGHRYSLGVWFALVSQQGVSDGGRLHQRDRQHRQPAGSPCKRCSFNHFTREAIFGLAREELRRHELRLLSCCSVSFVALCLWGLGK